MSARSKFAALLVVVMMMSLSGIPARAGVPVASPPDADHLASIALELKGGPRVRVRTASELVMLNRAQATTEGVAGLYGVVHDASITAAREEPRLVAWSEIARIERASSGMGRGALWGAGVGLVMGVAAAASIPPDERDPIEPGGGAMPPAAALRTGTVVLSPVAGAFLGALVGNAFPRWQRVHPAGPAH